MTTVTGDRLTLLNEWTKKIDAETAARDDAVSAANEAQAKYDNLRDQLDSNPTSDLASQVSTQGLLLDSLKKKARAAEADYQDFINSNWSVIREAATKIVKNEVYNVDTIKAKEADLVTAIQNVLSINTEIAGLFETTLYGAKSDVKPLEKAINQAQDGSIPDYNFWNYIPGLGNEVTSLLKNSLAYSQKWAGTTDTDSSTTSSDAE
jgi:vacuolar-type H+-ATPase subunit H